MTLLRELVAQLVRILVELLMVSFDGVATTSRGRIGALLQVTDDRCRPHKDRWSLALCGADMFGSRRWEENPGRIVRDKSKSPRGR